MKESDDEMGISVVLPNYNGRYLLEKNLPSLHDALEETELPYQIIVSDDCSTDDSVEYLKHSYPLITIVSTLENSGFSTACNTGIAVTQYRYTCVVNTDVSFDAKYFKNAIEYFENPDLFAIKGDIINYIDQPDKVVNVEKELVLYFKRGFFKYKPAEKRNKIRYDRPIVLLGCCFVCRTDLLKKLGGYDERFSPYYWEDLDLPLTALEKGYELAYAPNCIIYHQTSSTIGKTSSNVKRSLMSRRNKFILAWKHINSPSRWAIHTFFVVASLCTRWIALDWGYYLSFSYAVSKFRKK